MSDGKPIVCEEKEERQLSLFTGERSEDLAAIAGAALIMILTLLFI